MDNIQTYLARMKVVYDENPTVAVRGQGFIQILHEYIEETLNAALTPKARRRQIKILREARLFGSHKPKNVDVSVVDPLNGPLITVGVRSQMSSVSNNVLTYYQEIIGECVSLQERFPMTTMGYVYLHPMFDHVRNVTPDHKRYARMYANISHRDDGLYKLMIGSYDQFAYMVVDFDSRPLAIRDDIVRDAVPEIDMSIDTFIQRLITTFKKRNIWLEDIFDTSSLAPRT